MKQILVVILLLQTSYYAFSQVTLYNQNGISLSYTTSVTKSVFCNRESKTVNFVNLHYTVSNNSSRACRITSRVQMCVVGADCFSEDGVSEYQGSHFEDNRYVIVKPGESYYGDVGEWYYGTDASPCSWGLSPEFSVNEPTVKINLDPTPTKLPQITKQPTHGISQQGDVITNPKPAINYSQKQKQEAAATDNAMKGWQNSYKDGQTQITKINNSSNNSTQLQEKQRQLGQQQNIQRQQQAREKYERIQQQLADQQRRYEQTQQEFANATIAANNAYQAAIANGRKESGAMVDATVASASQLSDPTTQLVYTGVGLATALLMHFGEKKQERLESEAAKKRDEDRTAMIISSKEQFIKDALNINQYELTDLLSKERYAVLMLVPKTLDETDQNLYFTVLINVPMYSDSTYPLKDAVEKKLLLGINKSLLIETTPYTLYPILNIEKFQDEFVKKMGSGHLIYLKTQLTDFVKTPFYNSEKDDNSVDFWDSPVKKDGKAAPKKQPQPEKKSDSFWDN